jgi:hypothetical protein
MGGDVMAVNVGDILQMDFSLAGTVWNQKVTDLQTGQFVTFAFDLKGQAQNFLHLFIEPAPTLPVSEVSFTDITVQFANKDPQNCKFYSRGKTDTASTREIYDSGLSCKMSQVILRAN